MSVRLAIAATCKACGKKFSPSRYTNAKGERRISKACSTKCGNSTPLLNRFWKFVSKTGPHLIETQCWVWTGYINRWGYGQIWYNRTTGRAHRLSWELHVGPIEKDKIILHRCDNPACVRPEHLRAGTLTDNSHDMNLKDRNGTAVLKTWQVQEVRKLLAKGESYADIAGRYGVRPENIYNIKCGKTWRCLEDGREHD